MEYEIPAVHKGMLENILSNKALGTTGGIPFSAADWIRNGYSSMPNEVFSSIKLSHVPLLHSSEPGPGNVLGSHTSLPLPNSVPFRGCHRTSMNGVGEALGGLPLQRKGENINSPDNLETKAKKRVRSKGEKVNGPSQKKTRTVSSTDLTLSNGNVANGKTPRSRSRKRVPSGGGRTEETTRRKQRHQGLKKSEDEAEQRGGMPNEFSLKDGALHGSPNSGSTGVLDIYGLKTMAIDLSNYMVDISVNNLLSGNFQTSHSRHPGYKAKQSENSSSIVKNVSKILQLLPKQNRLEAQKFNMVNSENSDSKLQPQILKISSQCPVPQEEIPAMAGSEETNTMKRIASSEHSTAPVTRLPLYPLEDFLSRLELPANESLESLLLQAERELGAKPPDQHSYATQNDSIPPLQYSVPLNAASRSVPKRDKEPRNGSMWLRGGIAKCVNGCFGLDGCRQEYSECEEKDREHPNKRKRCEATERTGMIDLNLQSSEQLLEASMIDFHSFPLLPQPMKGLECFPMPNTACSQTVGHFEKPPILGVEAVTNQTPKIHDYKIDTGAAIELKAREETKAALQQLNFNRNENFEDQGEELKDLKIQRQLSLDKYSTQMADELQPSPSHSQTSQLNVERCMSPTDYSIVIPSSPRVEAAARLLLDMANSQPCDNEDSVCIYQEKSQDLLQQETLKDAKFVHRLVDRKPFPNEESKEIGVCKDEKIKALTDEKRRTKIHGSLLLVGKHWPLGKLKEAEMVPNQFQNRAYGAASKNNLEQGRKIIVRQDSTEGKKLSDPQISGRSSRPLKPITDGAHLKTKGTVLCSSYENRGNLQPKSLAGSEPTGVNVHILDKNNQNLKTIKGNHKISLSEGQSQQKVANVGHAKSSRQPLSFTARKR